MSTYTNISIFIVYRYLSILVLSSDLFKWWTFISNSLKGHSRGHVITLHTHAHVRYICIQYFAAIRSPHAHTAKLMFTVRRTNANVRSHMYLLGIHIMRACWWVFIKWIAAREARPRGDVCVCAWYTRTPYGMDGCACPWVRRRRRPASHDGRSTVRPALSDWLAGRWFH